MSWKLVCLWPRRPPGLEPRSELGRVPQSRGSWRVLPTRRKTARVLKEMSCFRNNLRRNRPSESGLGSFARPHSQRQVLQINGKLAGLRQRRGQPPSLEGARGHAARGAGGVVTPSKALKSRAPLTLGLSGRWPDGCVFYARTARTAKPPSRNAAHAARRPTTSAPPGWTETLFS